DLLRLLPQRVLSLRLRLLVRLSLILLRVLLIGPRVRVAHRVLWLLACRFLLVRLVLLLIVRGLGVADLLLLLLFLLRRLRRGERHRIDLRLADVRLRVVA